MKITIKPFPLLLFTLTFMLFVPIGTLSHEGGHIAMARALGYDTQLTHKSMTWDSSKLFDIQKAFYEKYALEIQQKAPFPERQAYEQFIAAWRSDSFKITIGGPLQTLLTSILGLFLLFFRRKKRRIQGLQFLDWVAIFLSIFSLRTTFNVAYGLARDLWFGRALFTGISDETKMADYLNLPNWTLSIIFGTLGLAIALFIIFNIIPKDKRLTFIIAGLIGGIGGYVLWMKTLGPLIIPA